MRYETVPIERVTGVAGSGDLIYVYVTGDGAAFVWWSRQHLTDHGPAELERLLKRLDRGHDVSWAPAPPRRLKHLHETQRWPRQFYEKDRDEAKLWREWRSREWNSLLHVWRQKLGLRGVVMKRLVS